MPKQIKEGTYYTLEEAATLLGVSKRSVQAYIAEGRLSAETHGISVMILEEDLMTFKANFTKWERK